MPLRFIVTLGLLLLGGLYLLPQNAENVRLTLWKGRAYDLPLILVVLGFALLGALGTGIWDLPSRIINAWRRSRHRRAERRIQEAEIFYRAGQASIAKGDRQAARRAFRRSLRRNPVHKQALLESGNLQRDLGRLDAAFDLHRRAIQAGSDDGRLIESLADDFAIAGRPDALRALLERVRYAGGDESIPLTRIRDHYISAGAWEIAAGFQKRLVRRPGGASDPDRMLLAHLLYEAGWQLAQAGKPADAEKRLNEAIDVHGDCIPPRVALGDVLRASGRRDQALGIWREGYEKTRAFIFLARILSTLGNGSSGEDTVQALRKARRRGPGDDLLQLALAEAYLRLGQPTEALRHLEDDSAKDTPRARLVRARALLDTDDVAGARAALSFQPKSGGHFHCTACQEQLTDWRGRCPSCGRWGTLDQV